MFQLVLYYIAFALGTFSGSCFLYSIVIYSQSLVEREGFSGIVFLFLYIPFPILFMFTGLLLDRFSRKLVLASFQGIVFLASFLIFFLSHELLQEPYLLLGLAFFHGIGMTVVLPGRMALLRDVSGTHKIVFHTIFANLLLIVLFGLSPLVIGALKEILSFEIIFLAIAIGHFLSLSIILFLPVERQAKLENQSQKLSAVLSYVKSDPILWQVLVVTIISMMYLGPLQVVLPKYIREVLGLGELGRGTVLFAMGPGLLLGGLLTIFFHHWRHQGRFLLFLLFVSGIAFLTIISFHQASVTSGALFIFGIFGGMSSSLLPSILQKKSAEDMRGRLLSIYMVCFQFTPALSGFLSAYFADLWGLVLGMQILGLLALFFSLVSLVSFRELRKF